jgi:hypothetical protein
VTDKSTHIVGIALRPKRATDLPILYAVPDLEPRRRSDPAPYAPSLTAEQVPWRS